jgi:integrase/recombinase XerD
VLMKGAVARGADPDAEGALWVNRWGLPFSAAGIRTQIKLRTKGTFGEAVWPHLFRHCAVTELVDLAPDDIGVTPDLLGHGSLAVTQRHYVRSSGAGSHRKIQAAVAMLRSEALKRRGAPAP